MTHGLCLVASLVAPDGETLYVARLELGDIDVTFHSATLPEWLGAATPAEHLSGYKANAVSSITRTFLGSHCA